MIFDKLLIPATPGFLTWNRSKRSFTVDLSQSADRAFLAECGFGKDEIRALIAQKVVAVDASLAPF